MAPDRRNIRIVLQRLSEAACVDCGLADWLVLQFDHLQSKTKDFASLVRSGCTSQRLINELNKCEVRCANCHRRRIAIQVVGSERVKIQCTECKRAHSQPA